MIPFGPIKSGFHFGTTRRQINISSVPIHDIETSVDRRARTLKHLIKANHANYSIIYHDLRFNNHMPHVLGSAYLLGAATEHLNDVYDAESKELEPWQDAPGEITQDDWRDFLGKREYQRAFVDFFEDQLVRFGYDWKAMVEHFLVEGKNPLINNLISGLAHPLIHLGYGYEFSSNTIAVEAVAMGCCCYDSLHKYLDDPSYTKPTSSPCTDLLVILDKIAVDKRFDGLFPSAGLNDIEKLLAEREDEVLEYWNAWDLSNPQKQLEESQRLAAALLVGTRKDGNDYDFFLAHLLTSSHAVRILLPLVPAEFQLPLIRQWWLIVIGMYILQLRPRVDASRIANFNLDGRDWKYVQRRAVEGKHAVDAHYVKALRALKEGAATWGDEKEYFLKSAVKFATEFNGWGGFLAE